MNMLASSRTALVVDDEFLIATMIEDILARQGIEVLTATRTDEATDHLKDRRVDFALIDFQMRSAPSESLWTELMAKNIPFAFCTGSLADEMRERFPGVLIIPKPFSEDAIIQVAQSLLAGR